MWFYVILQWQLIFVILIACSWIRFHGTSAYKWMLKCLFQLSLCLLQYESMLHTILLSFFCTCGTFRTVIPSHWNLILHHLKMITQTWKYLFILTFMSWSVVQIMAPLWIKAKLLNWSESSFSVPHTTWTRTFTKKQSWHLILTLDAREKTYAIISSHLLAGAYYVISV